MIALIYWNCAEAKRHSKAKESYDLTLTVTLSLTTALNRLFVENNVFKDAKESSDYNGMASSEHQNNFPKSCI